MRFERLDSTLGELKSRIKEHWSKLTDADLQKLEGRYSNLADVVAKRYSIAKNDAEEEVSQFSDEVGTTFREVAQHLGDAAVDAWRNGKHAVTDVVSRGSAKAGELWDSAKSEAGRLRNNTDEIIRERPLTSVLIAAGVGAVLGLLLRPRSR
ncbi:MAG: DUF883 family protein [Planctomycetes bacterium]|nr:DUF883 family protein [Planctomycetota bacterium]